MANLYELERALQEFELEIDEETGEILNVDDLDALQMERDIKVENIALWIKNLLSDAEAYKREKESFYAKEKAAKNKAERLKAYLQDSLGGQKFKTDRVTISYRRGKQVAIVAEDLIPEEYLRFSDPVPDKVKIKKDINEGTNVPGAALWETISMQIK